MQPYRLQTQTIVLGNAPSFGSDPTELFVNGTRTQRNILARLIDGHEVGVRVSMQPVTNNPAVKADYCLSVETQTFFSLDFRIPVQSSSHGTDGSEFGPRLAALTFEKIRDFCTEVNAEIARQVKEGNLDAKNGTAIDFAIKARDTFGGVDFNIVTSLGDEAKFAVRNEWLRDAVIMGCDYRFLQYDHKYAHNGDEVAYIELNIHMFGRVE